MGKLFLFALVALAAAYTYPETRPRVIEALAPALDPIRSYQTENEMEIIAQELLSYDRTYYKMPTDARGFSRWLEGRYQSETRVDSWGTPYTLKIWDDSFQIASGGVDREVGTPDDVLWLQHRKR